ncbi:lysophospholipid acyltransferase family protein [Arabiibacter massiliensis]|uniref:lysophospholipid acyltransferase family protein n=1 Tax=Arabiibacter massiliensis TaxID=1870985 RepID=UPI0009B9D40A|nr:lysophospholipid acyltransferase family protein [Arabiibacter massiliensis]
MSLFLPYEKMWDMPFGGTSDEKQAPHWSGNLIWGFLAFVFKICFRYKVEHRERIRAFAGKSGLVVIANHTSFLDVAIMYLVTRPKQWIRFMGRENLFGNAHGLVGQILSRVGAFPIKRDAADRTAIKRATRMLKNGEIVGIMPEGTRRGKSDRTPELHSGAAFIAKMGKVPILPMTVRNAENVKRKGERLHFPKISIEYGNPVLVEDFDFLPKEDRLDGCTWYAMRECFALSLRVPREQVDMPALFPGGKDFTAAFAEHPIPEHTSEEVVASLCHPERAEQPTPRHPERSAQRAVEGSSQESAEGASPSSPDGSAS